MFILFTPITVAVSMAASTQKMLNIFSNELNKNLGSKYFTWVCFIYIIYYFFLSSQLLNFKTWDCFEVLILLYLFVWRWWFVGTLEIIWYGNSKIRKGNWKSFCQFIIIIQFFNYCNEDKLIYTEPIFSASAADTNCNLRKQKKYRSWTIFCSLVQQMLKAYHVTLFWTLGIQQLTG